MTKDECAGGWIYERLVPWMRELGIEVLYEPREGEREAGEGNVKEGGEKRFGLIVHKGVRLARRNIAAKSGGKVKGGLRGGLEAQQEEVVRWEMCRVNPLLRFLKYGPGQFFQRNPTPPPPTPPISLTN